MINSIDFNFKNNVTGMDSIIKNNNKIIKEIDLNKIVLNTLNDMQDPLEDIVNLADKIYAAKEGVRDVIVVYLNEEGNYTLLSGERRTRACKHNLTRYDDAQTTITALIIDKPKNETEELDYLLSFNEYRKFDTLDQKIHQVKKYYELFQLLKEEGNKPRGQTRDWIAKRSGFGQKFCGDVIQMIEGKKDLKKSIKKDLGSAYKDCELRIQEKLGTKVTLKQKSLTISYTDNQDLQRVLEILGLGDVVNE